MKHLITIIAISTLICGCTAASYQTACFEQHTNFQDAVTCTQGKIKNDVRATVPVNAAMVNTILPYMDMIKTKVENGSISKTEGQYLIAQKIAEFDAAGRQRLIDSMKSSPSQQNTMTTCHAAGNTMNCHSF